jgi:hypothetical protein
MDKATKTKIILFASLGIFVLVVLAVTLALTGKGDNREEDGSVNTSLRAQQQSDFTLDDMMNTDGRPEYENFTDEVYRERSGRSGSDSLAGTVKAEPESRQSESGRSHETENGESPAEKGNAEEGRA